MNCREIGPLLSTHIDGALAPGLEAAVRGHLARCPRCARESERLASVRALLRELGGKEPRPFFETRVMSRIREHSAGPQVLRDFVAVAVRALYAGTAVLGIAIALNGYLSAPAKAPSATIEEYVFQGTPEAYRDRLLFNPEITERDVLSAAVYPEEV